MLGMRRTLWVVPRDLVAVVEAACTRAIAARERRRLEGFVAASGVSTDPARWLHSASAAALEAVTTRREAFTSDASKSSALLATKLRFGAGRWETEVSAASRILPLLAAEGALVRGRPRTTWVNGQYRWVPDQDVAGRRARARRDRGGAGRAPAALARRFRPRDRDGHPVVDRLDGPGDAGGALRRAARHRRARRRHGRRPRRRSRRDVAAWAVGGVVADPRSDDDGLEGTRLVPRPARAHPLRQQRQRRADCLVGRPRRRRLVAARRRRDRRTGCSRTSAPTRKQRSRPRPSACGPGSVTCASSRASCRRFSGSWRRVNSRCPAEAR